MAFDRKAYYQANKQKMIDTANEWRKRNKDQHYTVTLSSNKNRRFRDPIGYMLESIKYRAKKNGIEFQIGRDDVVIPSHCPILGIQLFFSEATGSKSNKNPNSPSIDRIDSSKGYIPGNILVCSWRANFLKNDATAAELTAMALYYTPK